MQGRRVRLIITYSFVSLHVVICMHPVNVIKMVVDSCFILLYESYIDDMHRRILIKKIVAFNNCKYFSAPIVFIVDHDVLSFARGLSF